MKDKFIPSVEKTVKNWWASLLIGILSIVIGICCLITPDTTLLALSYLFVWGFLLSGILEIIFALSNKEYLPGWKWTLTGGILDLILGFLLLALPPGMIALALIYFVGFWLLFRSVWMMGASFELKNSGVKYWGWLLALSILSVIFSFIIILSPIFSGVFIVLMVASGFIYYGILRMYLGFRLRSLYRK